MTSSTLNIIFIVIITLAVFVLVREIVCWYFKINERISNQKEIINQLKIANKYASQAEIDRL